MNMYVMKTIRESADRALLNQCRWLIEKTVHFEYLTICERAELAAPEGKILTLTSDGVVRDIKPGFYPNATISVTDAYEMAPHGLMNVNQISRYFQTAICVEDGKLSQDKCIPAAILGGTVTDEKTDGAYIAADAECFNGILIAGDSKYEIENVRMDLEGFGDNDFIGVGSAVAVVDKGRVDIRNCRFTLSGVTRCAVHVGGDSIVHVSDCEIMNISPASDWLGEFSWGIALKGTNRLCQLSDNGAVVYERCHLKSNGWALCSLDGTDEHASILIKDSLLELSGPRTHGYGSYCIGEDVSVTFDHSVVDVYGYPMLILGMNGKARPSIVNGSEIRGRRFGAMAVADDNSIFTIRDSSFDTGKSCLVVKGSATRIDVENSRLQAGNGVILQLMDTDETNMNGQKFFVPVGEKDTPIEGRDLARFDPAVDVELNLKNMSVAGDFFNSTTNIRAERRAEHGGMGRFHDTLVGPVSFDGPRGDGPDMPPAKDLNGPKNLKLSLQAAAVEGVISAALQFYRDGVTEITWENCLELSNVTQCAAPAVNNGVIVSLDPESTWTVTDTCYISSLTLAEGARLLAPQGKTLAMLVDGIRTEIKPGSYIGRIELRV